jgi:RimJ/RimL family protein N-acetyltransferase
MGDEAFVRRKHAEFILRQDVFLLAFDHASNQLIGTGGYHAIDWKGRIMSTGYWIRTSATGQGFATEIANALLRYAFGALAATRVAIGHADGNNASRRVIDKLGFEKEGIVRGSYFLQGKPTDAHYYARLNGDGLPPLAVSWGARCGPPTP